MTDKQDPRGGQFSPPPVVRPTTHQVGSADVLPGLILAEVIAVGRHSEVYKAIRIHDRHVVAVKCFTGSRRASVAQRRTREVAARARLGTNSVIPRLIDSTICRAGHPSIVMDYAAGLTLTEWIKRSERPALSDLLVILAELAATLAELHAANVLHCDVKPANVIIAHNSAVRLIDFGSAIVVGDATTVGATEVTKGFAAPELWVHAATPSPAADIFGLGAVAYVAFTGISPAPYSHTVGDPGYGAIGGQSVRADDLSRLPMPPALAEFFAGALEPNPVHRPSAVEAMQLLRAAATQAKGRAPAAIGVTYGDRKIFLVDGDRVMFGRGAAADLVTNDPGVSRVAVLLSAEMAGVTVTNMANVAVQVASSDGRVAALLSGDRLHTGAPMVTVSVFGQESHVLRVDTGPRPTGTLSYNERLFDDLQDEATTAHPPEITLSASERVLLTAYCEPMLLEPGADPATHAETAERLGRSPLTVRNRMTHIIERLRFQLPAFDSEDLDRDTLCRFLLQQGIISEDDLVLLADRTSTVDAARELLLSERDKDVLIALLAGYINEFPRYSGPLPTYHEVAAQMGDPWTSVNVRKRIERLKDRLSAHGNVAFQGPRANYQLAEYVLGHGLLGPADLARTLRYR